MSENILLLIKLSEFHYNERTMLVIKFTHLPDLRKEIFCLSVCLGGVVRQHQATKANEQSLAHIDENSTT